MKNKNILFVTIAMMALALAGCASKPEGELTGTVGELYNDAMDNLEQGRYDQAVHGFTELDRQYPYSSWAIKAQLNIAYANYLGKNYADAEVAAERFIKLHPGHKDAAYALYLIGLSHYAQISDVYRDQSATGTALAAFEELVRRYPDSEYARDAQQKIVLCLDHLAGKEMSVGRYYLTQKQYLPAINRFKVVVNEYDTTSQVPEALYRLTESYLALGVAHEAKRSASILGYNKAGSERYEKAYDLLTDRQLAPKGEGKSWAGKFVDGLKDIAK